MKEKTFSPLIKGTKISAEMKSALKTYLQANSDILDNKYVMQHKLDKQSDSSPKITKSQANKLSELSNLAVKMIYVSKFVKTITFHKNIKIQHNVLSTISTL